MCEQNLHVFCIFHFPFYDFNSSNSICRKSSPNYHTTTSNFYSWNGIRLFKFCALFSPYTGALVSSKKLNFCSRSHLIENYIYQQVQTIFYKSKYFFVFSFLYDSMIYLLCSYLY